MISQESIEEVRRRADLQEVLQHFGVTFKNKMACCPFHDEKSPSFHLIKPDEIRYKCFGCGISGDVFHFLTTKERMSFIEAVEWLAGHYNIILDNSNTPEGHDEIKTTKDSMHKVLEFAQKKYVDSIKGLEPTDPIIAYLNGRGWDEKVINEWGLGFAPDKWKFITSPLIEKGFFEVAVDLGLANTKNGSNYDFLRNRITFPIRDLNGVLIGISGRCAPGSNEPKYFNPTDSVVYKKSVTWYGLHAAKDAIRKTDKVYILEGYGDVITCHKHGVDNSICACGTSISDAQAKILLRYTKHIVLMMDGDGAGIKAADKQINMFLAYGAKVSIVVLPDNKDPDEWIRSIVEAPETDSEAEQNKKKSKSKNNARNKVRKKASGVRDTSEQDVSTVSGGEGQGA